MCTTEPSQPRRVFYKSIIREVKHTNSSESGCVSDDDLPPLITRHATDRATQTAPIFSDNSLCNSFNRSRSAGDILDRTCSKPPTIPCRYQRSNREPFHSFSSNLVREGKDIQQRRINSRTSRSLEILSLPILREKSTIDSGRGDSVQQLSSQILPETPHYELVRIHGCSAALMAKRYDFDPNKVKEYNRKVKPTVVGSSPKTTHLDVETMGKTARTNRKDSSSKAKSSRFFSLFRRSSKSSTKDFSTYVPIVRHHSATDGGQ